MTRAGASTYTYGDDLQLSSMALDGGPATKLERDGDGLVTGYGPFTLERGGPVGAVSDVADDAS